MFSFDQTLICMPQLEVEPEVDAEGKEVPIHAEL